MCVCVCARVHACVRVRESGVFLSNNECNNACVCVLALDILMACFLVMIVNC